MGEKRKDERRGGEVGRQGRVNQTEPRGRG